MPWHLSRSDPRKVYDERHEVVCVCQTPEQAARIVAAITGQPVEAQTIKLREPEPLGPQTLEPLETFHNDPCCTKHLMRNMARDPSGWECPKCGTSWKRWEILNV